MTGKARIAIAGTVGVAALALAGTAHAADGNVTAGGVTFIYQVDDAVQFDGPGCAQVFWNGTYQRPSEVGITVNIELRRRGSNSPETDADDVPSWSSVTTGTLSGEMCISDYYFDPSGGPFTFTGTLDATDDNDRTIATTTLPSATLPVRQNKARFNRLTVRSESKTNWGKVTGRVTAATVTKGRLGADGTVTVEVKQQGKWRHVIRLYPNEFGKFASGGELYTVRPVPKGAKVRARLTECGWCTNVKATTKAL
jgi:hypothetical protein